MSATVASAARSSPMTSEANVGSTRWGLATRAVPPIERATSCPAEPSRPSAANMPGTLTLLTTLSAGSDTVDGLQPKVAVGREPFGFGEDRGPGRALDRRPRVDLDRQGRTGSAGAPGADHLAVDQDGAGTAQRAPQVLLLGPFGHQQVPVAQLQVGIVRADEAHDGVAGPPGGVDQHLDVVLQGEARRLLAVGLPVEVADPDVDDVGGEVRLDLGHRGVEV